MGKHIKENLSQFVRRIIKEKKLKLRHVQDRSGGRIAQSYVSRIMTGDVTNITLDKLVALAKGIGEDEHTLFTAYLGRPAGSPSEPIDVFEMGAAEFGSLIQQLSVNPDLIETVKETADLPQEEREAVRRYALNLNERRRRAERNKKKPRGKTSN
jgi:transcriptional regulator with XRE-family HTH domain